jgi:hypothetical protein
MSVRAAAKSPHADRTPEAGGEIATDVGHYQEILRFEQNDWLIRAMPVAVASHHGMGVEFGTYAYAKVRLPLSWLSTRDARVGAY